MPNLELEMNRFHFIHALVVALCLLFTNGCTSESYTPQREQVGKDVIWIPTSQDLVNTMLDMANVTSADYVIDLGSGDGRLVITAAKRGAMALGIEYNPDLVELARRSAIKERVSETATFKHADIFKSDFSEATVLTLFLRQDVNLKLRPIILDMKPGTRIVSNTFCMGDWKPDQTTYLAEDVDFNITYFWVVPAKVSGVWKFGESKISFTQEFQNITGTMTIGKKEMRLTGKLDGNAISFTAGGTEYAGTVKGDTIIWN